MRDIMYSIYEEHQRHPSNPLSLRCPHSRRV